MSSLCIAKYNVLTGFSEFQFCDNHGQNLIGVYEFALKCVIFKLKKQITQYEIVCLKCNIVNSVVKNQDGSIVGIHSPIEYFQLKGEKNTFVLQKFSNTGEYFMFADKTQVQFWVTNLSEKKVDIELSVQFSFRKKDCHNG